MNKYKPNPFLEVALGAIIWGSNGIFIKYLNLPVVTMSFFRLSVPAIALFVIFSFRGVKLFKGNNKFILTASLLNAIRMFFYIAGFSLTSIGNAIILHYTYPIFTAIFSRKFLGEKNDKIANLLLFMTFLGVITMFINKEVSFQSNDFLGMLSVTLGAAVYSFSLIIYKKTSDKYSKYETVFYQNFLGALIFAPLIFLFPLPNIKQAVVASLQAFFIGLVAFSLFFAGLKNLKASTASFICYLEVVSAIVLAFIFFKEVPTWNMMLGGTLIIGSTIMMSLLEKRKVGEVQETPVLNE